MDRLREMWTVSIKEKKASKLSCLSEVEAARSHRNALVLQDGMLGIVSESSFEALLKETLSSHRPSRF